MNRPLSCALLACLLLAGKFAGISAGADELAARVARGEFAAAKSVVERLPPTERAVAFGQIAAAQASMGDTTGASITARSIDSASVRSDLADASALPGAGGGGAFADFQSLIDLIQTTVNPETWEALGGPSTMREYAQGVYVDTSGTLQTCEVNADTNRAANLSMLLGQVASRSGADDWTASAALRCVSLKRMIDALTSARIRRIDPDESLVHLAGLSDIQYVCFTDDDIVIGGAVGGIESHNGWLRDRQSGRAAIRLDVLATAIASARSRQPFGCTIDPTTAGLRNAANVAKQVAANELPIGLAAQEMVDAIGMQNIEMFGTAGDTAVGLMMVEADRHMKQLALGIHSMPGESPNYLDIVDQTIKRGPPTDLLLRLWFTAKPRAVRADAGRKVFELSGTPIRLSGENERAMADGSRGNLTRDFRTELFVEQFNQAWIDIRGQYPIYAGLESIYQAASLSALATEYRSNAKHLLLLDSLAMLGSSSGGSTPVARQVETIAVLHRVRDRNQRHSIVIASGGVAVNPKATVATKLVSYPALDQMQRLPDHRPDVIQRWWWDVATR